MLAEKTVASQRIYEGRLINLRVDTVELPDGKTAKREIVEYGGAVAIVALDDHENVLMVRQFRLAAGEVLLEIPAGGLGPGERPEECALRELREETGFAAGSIRRLGGFFSAPGFSTEYLHLYLATDLAHNPKEADEDENIELARVPLEQVAGMIAREEIHDAKSVAGLLLALLQRRANG